MSAEDATLAAAGPIDPDSLMAQACAATGLSDFGDRDFVEPLGVFLASALREAGLGPDGVAALGQDVGRLLTNRLLLQAELERHPEVADEDVDDPVVIVGLPRTGTTKLHRMIARDPSMQSVPLWKALMPVPLPGSNGAEHDPRIVAVEEQERLLKETAPDLMAAHSMEAHEPEEEVLLTQMTFERAGAYTWFHETPTYHAYLEHRPQAGAYGYLRRTLQYIQWQDGGRSGAFILKSPVHLGNLAPLATTFPRATIIHCHRRLDVALPSLCRLIEVMRQSRGSLTTDPHRIGAYMLEVQSGAWRRNLADRDALGGHARILDVHYDEVRDDVMFVIRRIYAEHGLDLDEDRERSMLAWIDEYPQGRFGTHRYSLERYGLSRESIANAFAGYIERFPSALPEER
jgi:hypothetical protein